MTDQVTGQDLINELRALRDTLSLAIEKLKERGKAKAKAENGYRIALRKLILEERDKGTPVTIISDICRGHEEIAKLKMNRDIAETLYETAQQKIYATKLELGIVERQLEAERKGL